MEEVKNTGANEQAEKSSGDVDYALFNVNQKIKDF